MGGFFCAGLDIGKLADYTALALLEIDMPVTWQASGQAVFERPTYLCRGLLRYDLGTSYPDMVTATRRALARMGGLGYQGWLVVDATGVGEPVVDMLYRAGLAPIAIKITGGSVATRDPTFTAYNVPKRDLVAAVQVTLGQRRLRVYPSPMREVLLSELQAFDWSSSPTGYDLFSAREGAHDDLVLAVAMALWFCEFAERPPRSEIVRMPLQQIGPRF